MPSPPTILTNFNYSLDDQFDNNNRQRQNMQLPAGAPENIGIIQSHHYQQYVPRSSPKDKLLNLTQHLSNEELKQAFHLEIKRLVSDYDRLISMLQQNSQILEEQNESLKSTQDSYQRRYEKAVREMQFFKKKYDTAIELTKQYTSLGSPGAGGSLSVESSSIHPVYGRNTSPRPSSASGSEGATYDALSSPLTTDKSSRPTSSSSNNSGVPYWNSCTSELAPVLRPHRNSNASTDISSRKSSCQPSFTSPIASPVLATTHLPNAGSPVAATAANAPLSGVTRSTTNTNSLEIQQHKVYPIVFGGSDSLWETIAKNSSDSTVEKMISAFLRRGGSPNTAKQSSSYKAVKYGFGMIHTVVVNKALASLNLLLKHGANPNAMTLSQVEDDKVTPAYLAASMGWLSGLQALVEAGADLSKARGAGLKNKSALQVAAEHCHTPIVEYIVSITTPTYHSQVDSMGANALHYASASGHTDLVLFFIQSCKLSVNQVDNRGEIPLHWASRQGHLEVASLLIERCESDCNSYIPRKSVTPYDLAKAGGYNRLVEYYKKIGALTAKKMDKKKEEEAGKIAPVYLESALTKNGLFGF